MTTDDLRGIISDAVAGAIAPISDRLDAIEAKLSGDHPATPDGKAA